jgi:uncharacterized membrane protein YgcG
MNLTTYSKSYANSITGAYTCFKKNFGIKKLAVTGEFFSAFSFLNSTLCILFKRKIFLAYYRKTVSIPNLNLNIMANENDQDKKNQQGGGGNQGGQGGQGGSGNEGGQGSG